jgi:hypothetical protein
MQRTSARSITGAGIGLALIVSSIGSAPAHADPDADDALRAVAAATPETVAAAAAVATDATGESAIEATLAGVDLSVPVDAADGISIGTSADAIHVALPFTARADDAVVEKPGIVSFDNNNGSMTVPIVQTDGSIQINTVIADEDAPRRYDYRLTAEAEQTLRLADDGSAYLADAAAKPILYIAVPWAKDAAGVPVPTHYEIAGTTLTQVVDFTEDTAFPVVADPWLGINLVDKTTWSGNTLMVYPSWYARAWGAPTMAGLAMWDEVIKRAPSANTGTMYNQFFCHWDLVRFRAPNKASWNLDKNRPNVGYAATVAASCNP